MLMWIQNILRLYYDVLDLRGVYNYPDILNHIYYWGLSISCLFITKLYNSVVRLDSNSAVRHFSYTENFVYKSNFDLFCFIILYIWRRQPFLYPKE